MCLIITSAALGSYSDIMIMYVIAYVMEWITVLCMKYCEMEVVLSPAGGGHCLALHRSLQRLYQEKHLRTFTPMPGAEEVCERERERIK